jgi:hypothetical protein
MQGFNNQSPAFMNQPPRPGVPGIPAQSNFNGTWQPMNMQNHMNQGLPHNYGIVNNGKCPIYSLL